MVSILWRNVQTWFISRPQLSVVRRAYRNLSPVVLAGAGIRGSSNSQQSKLVSSLPILYAFVKLNPPKAWHLLRWWIFAFMFQRTNKYSVYEDGRRTRGFGVGVSPELPWWFRADSPAVLPVLAAIPPAVLWKDLVILYLRQILVRNWGAAGKPGIVGEPCGKIWHSSLILSVAISTYYHLSLLSDRDAHLLW